MYRTRFYKKSLHQRRSSEGEHDDQERTSWLVLSLKMVARYTSPKPPAPSLRPICGLFERARGAWVPKAPRLPHSKGNTHPRQCLVQKKVVVTNRHHPPPPGPLSLHTDMRTLGYVCGEGEWCHAPRPLYKQTCNKMRNMSRRHISQTQMQYTMQLLTTRMECTRNNKIIHARSAPPPKNR